MPFSIQTNALTLSSRKKICVSTAISEPDHPAVDLGVPHQPVEATTPPAWPSRISFAATLLELTQGVPKRQRRHFSAPDHGWRYEQHRQDIWTGSKTLAAQSASATFTGDRTVLNKGEYQTLVSEIDRQAQGIGLSSGGHFAQTWAFTSVAAPRPRAAPTPPSKRCHA